MSAEQTHAPTWIAAVDGRTGRLFRGTRTEHNRVHLDEIAAIQDRWDEEEHRRTEPFHGKGAVHYEGHTDERMRRFAKEVAAWLDAEARQHQAERLNLFAEKRFLGFLRKELPKRLQGLIEDHPADLHRYTAGEIATRAEIAELVPERPAGA